MPPLPQAVIFDWDNTLVNTFPVIYQALNKTFEHFDRPKWSFDHFKKNSPLSLKSYFPSIFHDQYEEARAFFYAAYRKAKHNSLFPLPGAQGLLELFAAHGIYMAVVSNKAGAELREEAQLLEWGGYFGKIIGSLDCLEDKPSSLCVDEALSGSSAEFLSREEIWFVGDTVVDYLCAVNSGCAPILVDDIDGADKNYWLFKGLSHLLYYSKNLIRVKK